MSKPFLSIIVPAYNEETNLKNGSLSELTAYLSSQNFTWELIVVDDGSSDSTLKLTKDYINKANLPLKVIANPHQGKAATVTTGVLAANGQYILFTDMDQATPISEFSKFYPHLSTNDIIIGSRSGRKGAPIYRKILAVGMVMTRAIVLRLPFKDTQCGFKCFSSSAAKHIFSILNYIHPPKTIIGPAVNAGFDVELLYIGRMLGYKIKEIPVQWAYRESKRVNFKKDIINSLRELALVRARSIRGTYAKANSKVN